MISKVVEIQSNDKEKVDKKGVQGQTVEAILNQATGTTSEKKVTLLSNCKTPMKSKWDVPPLHGNVTPLIATIKYNNKHSSSKLNMDKKVDLDHSANTTGNENKNSSNATESNKVNQINSNIAERFHLMLYTYNI